MKRIVPILLVLLLIIIPISSTRAQSGPIRVGSKDFTESRILAYMIILKLEDAGFEVEDKTNFGDTNANREALQGSVIDVYPEYTGTAISNFYNTIEWLEIPEELLYDDYGSYAFVSSLDAALYDILWLNPSPANNTFAIALTRDFSEEHNIVTMEDFAEYVNSGGEIYLAADEDFLLRPDALPAFEETYHFSLDGTQMFVIANAFPSITERALADGVNGINASHAFSTDGLIDALDLVILEDTLQAQPIYNPVAVFRGEVVRNNPEIISLLNPIFASLDDETLRELNAQVDVDELDPSAVALDYLIENDFLGED